MSSSHAVPVGEDAGHTNNAGSSSARGNSRIPWTTRGRGRGRGRGGVTSGSKAANSVNATNNRGRNVSSSSSSSATNSTSNNNNNNTNNPSNSRNGSKRPALNQSTGTTASTTNSHKRRRPNGLIVDAPDLADSSIGSNDSPSHWNLYMPDLEFHRDHPLIPCYDAFIIYFTSFKTTFNRSEIYNKGYIYVDYDHLVRHCLLVPSADGYSVPANADYNLAAELKSKPGLVLKFMCLAAHDALFPPKRDTENDDAEIFIKVTKPLIIRLIKVTPLTALKDIKASSIGTFVAFRGTVVRVSSIKPIVKAMSFSCARCGHVQTLHFTDGKYRQPSSCDSSVGSGSCKSKIFLPDRSAQLETETVDWQNIKIQEIITDDIAESGRIPRTIDCEVTNDMVDTLVPGDIVTVVGTVKATTEDGGGPKNKNNAMHVTYIDANSAVTTKMIQQQQADQQNQNSADDTKETVEYTVIDLYAIQEISMEKDIFKLLVHSLCPSIFGHEVVKAGLLLALFGGRRRYIGDRNRIAVRGDVHVLVVGDPGLGKSQMLTAASLVAPRGVYVSGNATTTSGLTVSVTRDSGNGGYSLEAGALVLSDQGCCCIDEFDKMGADYQALLEAMEQQCISVAKAGIVSTLPARASVIAAANPVGGHYNKAKSVTENLKLNSALLSRFDLIFILLDRPNEEMDKRLSEHVIAKHSDPRFQRDPIKVFDQVAGTQGDSDENSILDRLRHQCDEIDPVPLVLLRKYIAYARKYVQPRLTPEACQVIQDFYLSLRENHRTVDSTPITTRQLESMVRMSEARARAELREKVTKQDAEDVVQIMKYSMFDLNTDEKGNFELGKRHGKKSEAKRFIAHLQKLAEKNLNYEFRYEQLYTISKDIKLQIDGFQDFLEMLNLQGYLIKPRFRVYKLLTN